LQALGQSVAHHALRVGGDVGKLGQEIPLAYFDVVDAEFVGHLVHQRLERRTRIDRAVAALCAARRQVRVDAPGVVLDRGDLVYAVQQLPGLDHRDDSVARRGTAFLRCRQVAGGEPAFTCNAELDGDLRVGTTEMRDEVYLAR